MNSFYNAASSFKECVSYAGKSIYYKVYNPNSFPETQGKNLPPEILSLICSNLNSSKDLQKVLGVCKEWDKIANDCSYVDLFSKFISPSDLTDDDWKKAKSYKYQLISDPNFLRKILTNYHYNFFYNTLQNVNPEDKIKLQNNPDLMLAAVKHKKANPYRHIYKKANPGEHKKTNCIYQFNLVHLIGDELKKNQEFLLEAVKEEPGFFRFLSEENKNKNAEIIFLEVNNEPSSIQFLSAEFIAEHRTKFYPLIEKNPENLKYLGNDFQMNNKNFMAKLCTNIETAKKAQPYINKNLHVDKNFMAMAKINMLETLREQMSIEFKNNKMSFLTFSDEKCFHFVLNQKYKFSLYQDDMAEDLKQIHNSIYREFPKLQIK